MAIMYTERLCYAAMKSSVLPLQFVLCFCAFTIILDIIYYSVY